MSKAAKGSAGPRDIAVNRKARHDYHLEEKFEAGLVLLGWEVKSLRAGKCNLAEAYVMLKDGEAWLFGCRIEPLQTASTHVAADPLRNRKLLLHRRQLAQIFAGVQRDGYTCVPVSLYWDRGRAKLEIALAKGKQKFDKRATEKERDWGRQKQRLMRRR
jgi:SsrA-binding protein